MPLEPVVIRRDGRNRTSYRERWAEFVDSPMLEWSEATFGELVHQSRELLARNRISMSDIEFFLWSFENQGDDEQLVQWAFSLQSHDMKLMDLEMFVPDGRCIDDTHPHLNRSGSFPVARRIPSSTASDESFRQVKQWLDGCLTHDNCKANLAVDLPTRVIDVGRTTGRIRLLETKGLKGTYTCLSYCWGKGSNISTTRATLAERMENIPFDAFPLTLRDAISFTRRLDVDYIWIDGLCIVQDLDWDTEAPKMAEIYRNAYLTIAATKASDCDGGLYSLPNPDIRLSNDVLPGKGPEPPCALMVRERVDHHLDITDYSDDFMKKLGYPSHVRHPLLTRAWAYQERLLSTRFLHFAHSELVFECKSSRLPECECGRSSYQISPRAQIDAMDRALETAVVDSPVVDAEMWTARLGRLWRSIVNSYSYLEITQPGDRLPAIGGLARHMGRGRRARYLAGLWEDTIHDDLMWYCWWDVRWPQPRPRPAPSWSWANVRGGVEFGGHYRFETPDHIFEDEEDMPRGHLCSIDWIAVEGGKGGDYGRLVSGTVQITGLVVQGVLRQNEEKDYAQDWDNGITPSCWIQLFGKNADGTRTEIRSNTRDLAVNLDHADCADNAPGTEIICLRMGWVTDWEVGDEWTSFREDGDQGGEGEDETRDGNDGSTARTADGSDEGESIKIVRLFSLVLKRSEAVDGSYERVGCVIHFMTPGSIDTVQGVFTARNGVRTETVTIV